MERPLAPLEKLAGILIPDRVQEFFLRPTELGDGWRPFPREELNSLSHLYPNHPLGCLPLFSNAGGDAICLYYPRGAEPLIAGFDREQGWLHPLDDVVEDFFISPERYEDRKSHWFKPGKKRLPVWESLVINAKEPAWRQLLKPWDVLGNARIFEAERRCAHSSNRSCRFRPLLERLAGEEPVAKKLFHGVTDLWDWFRWFRLGSILAAAKRPREASAIFSNALFVAHSVEPLWSKALLISQQLLDALDPPALPLYARQVQRWLPRLQEWADEE
ncbi:MAG TPA: hypothetical protein VF950_17320 [Planctomycetota bacterium]